MKYIRSVQVIGERRTECIVNLDMVRAAGPHPPDHTWLMFDEKQDIILDLPWNEFCKAIETWPRLA